MNRLFNILFFVTVAFGCSASQPREVRAVWLGLETDDARMRSEVAQASATGFNTVLLRVELPQGVAWPSAYAPQLSVPDEIEAAVSQAHADRTEIHAVILPSPDVDVDSLSMLYREMLLLHPFDGIVIDDARLLPLDEQTRYEFIDRLTLNLINEFPLLKTSVATMADKTGSSAKFAARLRQNHIVDNVIVMNASDIAAPLLADGWGDTDGIIMTYDGPRAEEARFAFSPWGIAFPRLDEDSRATLASGVLAGYAHLPQRDIRPSRPDSPINPMQEYNGNAYRLSWAAPEFVDPESSIAYYSVYDASTGNVLIPKIIDTEVIIPIENPNLRLAVSAWDSNAGESPMAVAAVTASSVADELQPETGLVEISAVNSTVTIRSTAGQIGTVDIYNLEGMIVKSRRINRPTASINCSSLPAGLYIVSLRTPSGIVQAKKILLK